MLIQKKFNSNTKIANQVVLQELSFCHRLKKISEGSEARTLCCKDIEVKKSVFVAKTQFLFIKCNILFTFVLSQNQLDFK